MRSILASLLMLLAVPVLAAGWSSYENARFGYAIAVPPGFRPGPETVAGGVFANPQGTQRLRVSGGELAGTSFEARAEALRTELSAEGWHLSEVRMTPSWASFAGRRNGMLLQARSIALCGGSRSAGFAFVYPARDVGNAEAIGARLAGSLRGYAAAC